jgi:hypothetical protein
MRQLQRRDVRFQMIGDRRRKKEELPIDSDKICDCLRGVFCQSATWPRPPFLNAGARCARGVDTITLIEVATEGAGVRTNLPKRNISSNGLVSVEEKGRLWYTTRCHL